MNDILCKAQSYFDKLAEWHRWLHKHPELGFKMTETLPYVEKELQMLGVQSKCCGKAGLTAVIQGRKPGSHTLLRADMDALPIRENTSLPYRSDNGNMHACGHDMHTAMLLGAAKLLKEHETKLHGTVTLMFQPAEELLEGAKDMLDHGLLDDIPQRALALHVIAGSSYPGGTLVIPAAGIAAPEASFFEITIVGKGCHGASPWLGIDPLPAAAHLLLALQSIPARETPLKSKHTLTVGSMRGGTSANAIPDQVSLSGTLRAMDETSLHFAKERIKEITNQIASAFRCGSHLEFKSGCPPLVLDRTLIDRAAPLLVELLGKKNIVFADSGQTERSSGSEDFSYISQKIPSLLMSISAGSKEEGFVHPLHHPKVCFDEKILPVGAAVLAYLGLKLNINE